MSGDTAFDPAGPLPTGITLLQASAGTGKTHAIAGLVARYVAEGVATLDRILVVTYTRLATAELRERVRLRLREAEADLGGPGAAAGADDRLRRVRDALADFDAATIATTHGFCQRMLAALGTAGGVADASAVMPDTTTLTRAVAADLHIAGFRDDAEAVLTATQARDVAEAVIRTADARLTPAPSAGDIPGRRSAFAGAVRREHARRLRAAGAMSFDDLVERVRSALTGPATAQASAARLAARFAVVLVDEFQDTDPMQWEVLRRAFGGGTLVLIGDPKQAIYGFRGADVQTYLTAVSAAGTRRTLDTNWRSDGALLDALEHLLLGLELGDERIRVEPVHASDPAAPPGIAGPRPVPPLQLRMAECDSGRFAVTSKDFAQADSVRAHICEDLAGEVVRLLRSGATIREDGRQVPVHPGHVAVLVRTHAQAALVRRALQAAGLPAALQGGAGVLDTPAAADWLALLRGLERPWSPGRAGAAALTPLMGWTARRLAQADDAARAALTDRLIALADTLERAGAVAVLAALGRQGDLGARLLGEAGGERALTDLRHVAQLLDAAAREGRRGPAALIAWLATERSPLGTGDPDEIPAGTSPERRVEVDDRAVRVMTVHGAKGLEFPVVMLPFLWSPAWIDEDRTIPVFHDRDRARAVDVGGPESPGHQEHLDQHLEWTRAEELRLTYVALTRARHRVTVWWTRAWNAHESALCRVLLPDHPPGQRAPEDAVVRAAIEERIAGSAIELATTAGAEPTPWSPPASAGAALAVRPWSRAVDTTWARHSFSSTIEGTEPERIASEPDLAPAAEVDDTGGAPADDGDAPAPYGAGDADPGPPLPLGDAPGGTGFGSLVHAVLEEHDPAAADPEADLRRLLDHHGARIGVGLDDPAAVARGLAAAVAAPLAPGLSLRDLGPSRRRTEVWFEFPLARGDSGGRAVTPAALAALWRRHLPPEDPLAPYAERLEAPGMTPVLRGYLTGAIDLIARLPDGRYAVMDHKTNRLGPAPLRASHYRPGELAAEMVRAHYPLQALVYLVALHRILRWRLAGYDPGRHLAGAAYLFLRGMGASAPPDPADPTPGVFWWRPPAALVTAADDLMAEGTPA